VIGAVSAELYRENYLFVHETSLRPMLYYFGSMFYYSLVSSLSLGIGLDIGPVKNVK